MSKGMEASLWAVKRGIIRVRKDGTKHFKRCAKFFNVQSKSPLVTIEFNFHDIGKRSKRKQHNHSDGHVFTLRLQ